MLQEYEVDLAPDLVLTIGAASARLTPGAGFRLAESLIRVCTRRLIELEVELAEERPASRRGRGE
jgi:hypothetical protein